MDKNKKYRARKFFEDFRGAAFNICDIDALLLAKIELLFLFLYVLLDVGEADARQF